MKQEDFEWLEKWIWHILMELDCERMEGEDAGRGGISTDKFKEAINHATEHNPPPIDEPIVAFHGWTCDKHKIQVPHNKACPKCIDEITEEEPKPDLKVKIGGGHCVGHDTDFISKDGHYYCPKCFPDGIKEEPKEYCTKCGSLVKSLPNTSETVACGHCGQGMFGSRTGHIHVKNRLCYICLINWENLSKLPIKTRKWVLEWVKATFLSFNKWIEESK